MGEESGLHNLVESLAGLVMKYGERTGGENETGSENGISRSRSWESYVLECEGFVLSYIERKRSGMKADELKLYRVVRRELDCVRDESQVIALFETAEGNWYPNPDIQEDSLSSFGRVKFGTSPQWTIGEEDNPAILAQAHGELQKKYCPLQ